jgi:hypothetical protein
VNKEAAQRYLREHYRPEDRVAVALIRHPHNSSNGRKQFIQRLQPIETVISEKYMKWLAYMNEAERWEIGVSINTIKPDAIGRQKADVNEIRHIGLDLDHNKGGVIDRIKSGLELPTPNDIMQTSPGRYQIVWRVEGLQQAEAEQLQRDLVAMTGGDPAATDSTRDFRIPGFRNNKYDEPYMISAETLTDDVYRPASFPDFLPESLTNEMRQELRSYAPRNPVKSRGSGETLSQSEHDWAYANRVWLRAIRAGQDAGRAYAEISARITMHRPEKSNPQYYGEHTTSRAYARVAIANSDEPQKVVDQIIAFNPKRMNARFHAEQAVRDAINSLNRSRLPSSAPER